MTVLLVDALRQYRCSDSDDFVFGYDIETVDKIVTEDRIQNKDLLKRARTTESESMKYMTQFKGLERVAKVVSDNSDEICMENNLLKQQAEKDKEQIDDLVKALKDLLSVHVVQADVRYGMVCYNAERVLEKYNHE